VTWKPVEPENSLSTVKFSASKLGANVEFVGPWSRKGSPKL